MNSTINSPFDVVASSAGGGTVLAPAGTHAAVLVALIDLGTHTEIVKDQKTNVESEKDFRKILLAWELTTEPLAGTNRNHVVARDYNVVFSQRANLRLMMEKWRGRTYGENEPANLRGLLGQKCLLTIVHGKSGKGNDYAKVDGVSPVPKGFAVPEPKHKPTAWSLTDGEFPAAQFDWLPYLYGQSVASKIASCLERRVKPGVAKPNAAPAPMHVAAPPQAGDPAQFDDVPF